MPIYQFSCGACAFAKKFLMDFDRAQVAQPKCPACQSTMNRQFGEPTPIAMEICDQYRGTSRFADTNAKREARSDERFQKVELPKILSTPEGRDTARRMGWLKDQDKPKQ